MYNKGHRTFFILLVIPVNILKKNKVFRRQLLAKRGYLSKEPNRANFHVNFEVIKWKLGTAHFYEPWTVRKFALFKSAKVCKYNFWVDKPNFRGAKLFWSNFANRALERNIELWILSGVDPLGGFTDRKNMLSSQRSLKHYSHVYCCSPQVPMWKKLKQIFSEILIIFENLRTATRFLTCSTPCSET